MKETKEQIIKIGFVKQPAKVFDEIESVSALMIRDGWQLIDTCIEDGMGSAHLFFEREIENIIDSKSISEGGK